MLMFAVIQSQSNQQNNFLPWLNKTSLVDVSQTVRNLLPYKRYQFDNEDLVSGYINEVKPYHVYIKNFIHKYTVDDHLGIGAYDSVKITVASPTIPTPANPGPPIYSFNINVNSLNDNLITLHNQLVEYSSFGKTVILPLGMNQIILGQLSSGVFYNGNKLSYGIDYTVESSDSDSAVIVFTSIEVGELVDILYYAINQVEVLRESDQAPLPADLYDKLWSNQVVPSTPQQLSGTLENSTMAGGIFLRT
jgi:hypothetical protein